MRFLKLLEHLVQFFLVYYIQINDSMIKKYTTISIYKR
jgi:hypothetical protein